MATKKPGHYFCDLWKMHYFFFVGRTYEEFKKYLESNYGYEIELDPGSVGHTIMLSKGPRCYVFIWVKKKTDYPSIAHECLHASNWTLGRAGVKADFYNDEPVAYLMTNLIEQSLRGK